MKRRKDNKITWLFIAAIYAAIILLSIGVTAMLVKNPNFQMGGRIKQRLDELGMSQRELAKACKVTEVSMSRYISGDRTPKGPIISQIARTLGVTSDWLLGME